MLLLAAHGTTAAEASSGAAVAPAPTDRTEERQGTTAQLATPRIDAAAFAAPLGDPRLREHV